MRHIDEDTESGSAENMHANDGWISSQLAKNTKTLYGIFYDCHLDMNFGT
jgi:hypothetical protein